MRENNVPLIQLQVKLKKITDITYLEGNEKKWRDWIKSFDIWKWEKRYYSCFESQTNTWKVNVALLPVINKEIRYSGVFRL